MRHVVLHAIADGLAPDAVYQRISDFRRYPELTGTVRDVQVDTLADGSLVSDWTVLFRGGLMRWRERDTLSPETGSLTFEQLDGDFQTFEGSWRCAPHDDGTLITFTAAFDLGIPTLADILDPVAESTLRTNIAQIVAGLVQARVVDAGPADGADAADAADATGVHGVNGSEVTDERAVAPARG
ncbi:type II toxin-antitoxin system RatA family toxin [Streptomyces sp. NPDC001595]|uniref:type II toxin-antitoxin system RatA family toxin n=1 Tax=Streptomyces sp. NPDC001532 TaxID=3154520 RepID=UPI00331AB009